MGRIKLWSGIHAMQMLKKEDASHRKNREAEEAWARKTVWGSGSNGEEQAMKDDDEITILGDINTTVQQPQPPQQQPQQKSILPALAAALLTLAAGLGIGFAASKWMADPQTFDDETVSVGLGKIEDYLKADTAD